MSFFEFVDGLSHRDILMFAVVGSFIMATLEYIFGGWK